MVDDMKAAERLPAGRRTRQFGRVSGLEKDRIGFTSCGRSHILAVTGSGGVYGWELSSSDPTSTPSSPTSSSSLTPGNGSSGFAGGASSIGVTSTLTLPSPLNVTKAPIAGAVASTPLASGISSDVCSPGGGISAVSLHHLPSVAASLSIAASNVGVVSGSMLVRSTSVDTSRDNNTASPVTPSRGGSVSSTPVQGIAPPIARLPRTLAGLVDLPIVKVACGVGFTIAVTRDGRMYTWGIGSHGRLGHGTYDNELHPRLITTISDISVVSIAAGWAHAVCVTGTLLSFSSTLPIGIAC
jgi:hypothetical protein